MIIESIGNGYYAGVMRGLDLIVVRREDILYEGNDYTMYFSTIRTNPRLEIIKKLSEIAFF